jgi:hypothetical protein
MEVFGDDFTVFEVAAHAGDLGHGTAAGIHQDAVTHFRHFLSQ